jgi:hypothetical protein
MNKVPLELYSRALDVGVKNPTEDWLINEAKYVMDMITSGGSSYDCELDRGKKIYKQCEKYLKSKNIIMN